MIWIVAGTAAMLAGLLAMRAFMGANPVRMEKWLRFGFAALLLAAAGFLALTGRLVLAIPVAGWALLLLRKPKQQSGAAPASSSNEPKRARTSLSRQEALEILGLRPDATKDEIREAHRRLMQTCHPDHGGSSYLAARINAAKDVLLSS